MVYIVDGMVLSHEEWLEPIRQAAGASECGAAL